MEGWWAALIHPGRKTARLPQHPLFSVSTSARFRSGSVGAHSPSHAVPHQGAGPGRRRWVEGRALAALQGSPARQVCSGPLARNEVHSCHPSCPGALGDPRRC